MTDRVGHKIGNYRLVKLLGEGGFAEVYLAEHTYLGSYAAIKLLYVRVAPEDIAQFQQEGRMLAALLHPQIVRVLDFGIEDRTPYLVMDYAPGGTLRSRHPKGSRVPLPTIVEYVKQIAQALQHAHDHKFIHRDIKPENMLISREGTLLLSDFGIAVISRSERTSLNSQAGTGGTPYYMAPELFAGKPRTASDQYSLGVVVYEWLCGVLPFAEGNAIQLGFQHTYQPVPPLRQHLPTLSPAVEQVILTALAKKPEERFGSIRAFATALERASLPAPIPPPRSPVSPAPPQPPSNVLPVVQSRTTPPAHVPSTPQGTLLVTYRGHSSKVESVAWSPDGARIASGSANGTVQVWNARDGSLLFTYDDYRGQVYSVAWSPDSTRIASGSIDRTVQVWNAHDGSLLFTYHRHRSYVYSVAWSPDSTRIASSSDDKTVQVWNAHDGSRLFTYRGHSDSVLSVAWSPDGTRIVSGSSDGVQVWNASNGSRLFTYRDHRDTVRSVTWSPDGRRIASGSTNGTVQVWNARDGSQPFTYRRHRSYVDSVAWSSDGTYIASGGSADGTVQVWNAHDGSEPFTYRGHSATVYSVAWSPDGRRIASGSGDNTVQVWQAV